MCQQQSEKPNQEQAHLHSELAFINGQLTVVLARLEALQVRVQANGAACTAGSLRRVEETLGYLAQDVRQVLVEIGES